MNSSRKISFTIDLPVTAEISLSDSSPVKAGTITVTLITSKDLSESPTLEYSFDDNPAVRKQVSMSGSGSLWTGYIIITEDDDNKIGTFYFSGKDSLNNIGTEITEGKIFVVDASKPSPPMSIRAIAQKGKIELEWYSDSPDIDYYKIYRSTSSGIDFVDYYASTNSSKYYDSSIVDQATYFYKVASVDKAGNIGSLSSEVYATAINEAQQQTTQKTEVKKVLPPALVDVVDKELKEIGKYMLDVDDAILNLAGVSDPSLDDAMEDLSLAGIASNAKSKLQDLKKDLENMKQNYATSEEVDLKISNIELELKKIRLTTPRDIKISQKSEFIHHVEQTDMLVAAQEAFKQLDTDTKSIEKYVSRNLKENDNIRVVANMDVIEIDYLDGSKKYKTIIQKSISNLNSEPYEEVVFVEIIPKSIAEDTSLITFLTDNYDVLKRDPIIKWGFVSLDYNGQQIKYIVDGNLDASDVKKTKSIVLLNVNSLNAQEPNAAVTGYSVFPFSVSASGTFAMWLGIGIIIALSAYYLFFIKGVGFLQRSPHSNDIKHLHSMIRGAHSLVDSGEIEAARQLYRKIERLYSTKAAEVKRKVYPHCSRLHKKLSGSS